MAVTRVDYSEQAVAAAHSVLLELVHLLGEYRDSIVLIGGMVPRLLIPQADLKVLTSRSPNRVSIRSHSRVSRRPRSRGDESGVELRSRPGVGDFEPGEASEVLDIPGDDAHCVHLGCCCDEGVSEGGGVGDVQRGGLSCDVFVDGEEAIGERGDNAGVEPLAQNVALGRVATLCEEYAMFEFVKRDHRHEHECRGDVVGPNGEAGVGLARFGFAKLRNDVGVEDEHYSKRAGGAGSREAGASKSMSSTPAGSASSSMMLGWFAARRW